MMRTMNVPAAREVESALNVMALEKTTLPVRCSEPLDAGCAIKLENVRDAVGMEQSRFDLSHLHTTYNSERDSELYNFNGRTVVYYIRD